MAALDFPDAPTVGQVYDKWTWNGTAWALTASGTTPWTALTLTNGWVSIAGNQAAQYRKVNDEVQLRGNISTGTVNTSAFTLPAGFRPPANMDAPLSLYAGGPQPALAVINAAAGTFTIYAANSTQIGLNSVRFSVST